jgi:hypothetical protein
MRKITLILSLLSLMIYCNSCDDSSSEDESPEIAGQWVRIPGPSGDRTDLAIGGIDGEPVNRVYICEKKGSTVAGLYKGILTSANVIVWDSGTGLPNTYVRIVGSQLEFDYKCCGTVPTYYNKGAWSGECGPLKNTSIQLAVGLDNREFSGTTTIKGVSIDGKALPLTLLNATTTAPDCSSNSFITLPEPKQSNQNGGYYLVSVTYQAEGISGYYTATDTQAFYKYYFKTGCNKYKVGMDPTNKFSILPL